MTHRPSPQAMVFFKNKGIGVLQGGTWHGLTYTYLESEDTMSMIAEIYAVPEDFEWPTPEATYP